MSQITAAPPTKRHQAGGKSLWPMMPGVRGDALFAGTLEEHRLWLERRWDDLLAPAANYALWLGMNPSTAEKDMDDPTVRWTQVYTRDRLGLSRTFMTNAGSYRSTAPAGLAAAGVPISHPENQSTIIGLAKFAKVIIIATGEPPAVLQPLALEVLDALRATGRPLKCLGLIASGWPRHPSRLAYATDLVDFA